MITCWMLSTLTALLSEMAALVLSIIVAMGVVPTDALRALALLVVLTALCSGSLGIVFLPLAIKVTEVEIPRIAIVGGLMICLLPWLLFLVGLLAR